MSLGSRIALFGLVQSLSATLWRRAGREGAKKELLAPVKGWRQEQAVGVIGGRWSAFRAKLRESLIPVDLNETP